MLPAGWAQVVDMEMQPVATPFLEEGVEMTQRGCDHGRCEQRMTRAAARKSMKRMGGKQEVRGITLRELKELRDNFKMEEKRWFCANYPKKCTYSAPMVAVPSNDPASSNLAERQCPECQAAAGTVRTRNLYELMEVVNSFFKEAKLEISYVEYLMRRDERPTGRKVKTFVSHWWGEEFKDLVASLDSYATSRCIQQQRLRLWTFLHSIATLALNFLILNNFRFQGDTLLHRASTRHVGLICLENPITALWIVAANASITTLILACLILEGLRNKAQADDWTFWICAFANNQSKLKHALGKGVETSSFALALKSDIHSVVCVIDPDWIIYTRIWCAFELFYVKKVLPRQKPEVPIVLINEKGLISEGGLRKDRMHNIQEKMAEVRTENAQASQPEDKEKIDAYMKKKNVEYQDLDKTLKELTQVGLDSVDLRRRAFVIMFFLCPMASYVFSDFWFWCVMKCRPQSKAWDDFKEKRHLHSVGFKMGFYFFASLFALVLLLLMVSVNSTEAVPHDKELGQVLVEENDAEEEDLSDGDGALDLALASALASARPGSEASPTLLARARAALKATSEWLVQRMRCWPYVKELKIRLAGPSALSRLQSRVLKKSTMMISTLMGPGLTPSLLAGCALLLMRRWHDVRDQMEKALDFLYIVREVWNVVQVVYAVVGLVLGSIYWYIRDRKIGLVRSFLEEILL